MNSVCEHLKLVERDYFGFTYLRSYIKFWINMKKPISKQIKKGPWIVAFELKFYPDPIQLQDEITRYQVFQQVRRDICSGKLPCSFVALSLLCSYVAQSQLGDYNPESHGSTVDYLKILDFSPAQNEELLEKVAELHRTHRGQNPPEAELYYLDNAKNLALYGVHLHEAKNAEGEDVSVGVCSAGLLIYKDRLRVNRYTWPKILKIRYKRNYFHIDVRPDENDPQPYVASFKLTDVKMAKRLWRIAVEHHAFFRLREPELTTRGLFSRANYRYSGRTLYQSRRELAHANGSRSMDNLATGYSTERWEKHVADDVRTATLDLRRQKGGGSLGNLDVSQYDPGLDGQVALLAGAGYDGGRATYNKPANGSLAGYIPAGSQAGYRPPSNASYQPADNMRYQQNDKDRYTQLPVGNGYQQQYYGGYQDGASIASQDYSGRPHGPAPGQQPLQHWNHGEMHPRPMSMTSDLSSLPSEAGQRPPRRKHRPKSSQQSSVSDDRHSSMKGQHLQQYNDPGYSTIDEAVGNGWRPQTNSTTKTSTRTYTAPDGTIITEYRTEKNGVIETRVEKRTRVASVPEESVDYDKELADAIFAVTKMNPDLAVQKIEIHTRGEEV
jgi:erythrocyte membrane protein band 4.1